MIVYFTASVVGKKQYLTNYIKIIDLLKAKNYQVIADHIIKVTEIDIRFEKREDRLRFHAQLEKWIGSCNFMIVEASFPSISVGYEISLALRLNKPVLILYGDGDPPSLFAHHKEENLLCEKYTFATLKDILDDFINYVHAGSDSRFTFFITPKIANYLDEVARKQKIPKSVYLRKLIEQDMKPNR